MLVFLMHGTSVRDVDYSQKMQGFIFNEFMQRGELSMPNFYPCFLGDIIGADELWDSVLQDLALYQWEYPSVESDRIFSYQTFRQKLITQIFGDIFTYLNSETGSLVRKSVALQLLKFLKEHPGDNDLHLVAHSLGSVILWDILFSDKFSNSDPAVYIRDVIKGLSPADKGRKVYLRSLTTMGSPILFFDRLLGIGSQKIDQFASHYIKQPLRWINIINATDVFAYPLYSSLNLQSSHLFFKDKYLESQDILQKKLGGCRNGIRISAKPYPVLEKYECFPSDCG